MVGTFHIGADAGGLYLVKKSRVNTVVINTPAHVPRAGGRPVF
jgi:hypothetical protein